MIAADAVEFTASLWMSNSHLWGKHSCPAVFRNDVDVMTAAVELPLLVYHVECPPTCQNQIPQTHLLLMNWIGHCGKHYLKVNFSNQTSWAGPSPQLFTALPTFPFPFIRSLSRQRSQPPDVWAIISFSRAVTFDDAVFNIACLFLSLMRQPDLCGTTGNNHHVTNVTVTNPVELYVLIPNIHVQKKLCF